MLDDCIADKAAVGHVITKVRFYLVEHSQQNRLDQKQAFDPQ
jgi:hypothetical protein